MVKSYASSNLVSNVLSDLVFSKRLGILASFFFSLFFKKNSQWAMALYAEAAMWREMDATKATADSLDARARQAP